MATIKLVVSKRARVGARKLLAHHGDMWTAMEYLDTCIDMARTVVARKRLRYMRRVVGAAATVRTR